MAASILFFPSMVRRYKNCKENSVPQTIGIFFNKHKESGLKPQDEFKIEREIGIGIG